MTDREGRLLQIVGLLITAIGTLSILGLMCMVLWNYVLAPRGITRIGFVDAVAGLILFRVIYWWITQNNKSGK